MNLSGFVNNDVNFLHYLDLINIETLLHLIRCTNPFFSIRLSPLIWFMMKK